MKMWKLVFIGCLVVVGCLAQEDNEFAEFEDDVTDGFSEPVEETIIKATTPAPAKTTKDEDFEEDFGIVEDEAKEKEEVEETPAEPLKFTDVPAHFRSNWASYQVEAVVIAIISIYLLNYIYGRAVNQSIANTVFEYCKPILEEQFALVGDDGVSEVETIEPQLRRDTDYIFTSWCTGRTCVNSMQLQMRMVKRQDVVSRILNLMEPCVDKVSLKFVLESDKDTEPIVMAIGDRKTVVKNVKEMLDLSSFTVERKQTAVQMNLPQSYALYTDQNEIAFSILEPGVVSLIKKYEKVFDIIHISDQFTGPKPQDGETYTRLPETQRYMHIVLNLDYLNEQAVVEEVFTLVFYLVEKIRKFKLSKEAHLKAEKKRREFEEIFLKNLHQYRQEAAQARKEEKTRERKQKLLEESDPDRQRRLEAKELKREAKAKAPKMKQLKVR